MLEQGATRFGPIAGNFVPIGQVPFGSPDRTAISQKGISIRLTASMRAAEISRECVGARLFMKGTPVADSRRSRAARS